jgi:hypothetical protein
VLLGSKAWQKQIFVKGMGDIVDDDCHKTSNRLVKEPWLGVVEGYIRLGFGAKGGMTTKKESSEVPSGQLALLEKDRGSE